MASTILSSPIFGEVILPFILIFVVVFAILQKTKILGEGKKQIDSIVSLVVALIAVSFGWATGVIVKLMPFLAVAVVIILILLILMGFIHGEDKAYEMPKGLKIGVGVAAGVALIVAILWATGSLEYIWENLFGTGTENNAILSNVIFIIVIIAVIVIALTTTKNSGDGEGKKKNS